MAILRERVSYREARPANETRHSSDLTQDEQKNARAAIRFLAKRHGTYAKLAKAMGANLGTVRAATQRGIVSAGIALRVARVAGVSVEDVLGGRFPVAGACPLCGKA
jgi:hypothetical protein